MLMSPNPAEFTRIMHSLLSMPMQVFLSVVEDSFSAPFWGLYGASPTAKYLQLRVTFPGVPSPVDCETAVKSCEDLTGSDWHTLVMIRCPVPEDILADYAAAGKNHQELELSIESVPSVQSTPLSVCIWEQPPATPAIPSDKGLKTAVCVRPFRPYFFGTTTPSVSKEQVRTLDDAVCTTCCPYFHLHTTEAPGIYGRSSALLSFRMLKSVLLTSFDVLSFFLQIVEWISHHLNVGLDRIYLYDR